MSESTPEQNTALAASVTNLSKSKPPSRAASKSNLATSRAASKNNLTGSRATSRADVTASRVALNTGTGSRAASKSNLTDTPSRSPSTGEAPPTATDVPPAEAEASPAPDPQSSSQPTGAASPLQDISSDSTQPDTQQPLTDAEADALSSTTLQTSLDTTAQSLTAPYPTSTQLTEDEDTEFSLSYGPETVFLPHTKKVLDSPLPGEESDYDLYNDEDHPYHSIPQGGFTFVNTDYTHDPDDPNLFQFSSISHNTSQTGEEEDDLADEEVRRSLRNKEDPDGSRTPILRPSSPSGPVVIVPVTVLQTESGDGVVGGEVVGGGAGGLVEREGLVGVSEMVVQEGIDRDELILSIKGLLDEKDKLKGRNGWLQNKLGEYFRRKRTDETRDTEKPPTDLEHRYTLSLQTLSTLHETLLALNTTNEKTRSDLRSRLSEKLSEAENKSEEFQKFKKQIALGAENSRTGKGIQGSVLEGLEGMEERKEQEVVSVRLENIKLRNKLRRHEALLKQKEELADGLHLIDFEQLKIENQTYNEKIEERNEELLKLRRKITTIVHLLTHVKEKLQFVQSENTSLQSLLSSLDAQVSQQRDTLPQQKQQRDRLRNENVEMRRRNGLVGNRGLLRDFEGKVDASTALQKRLEELKALHGGLVREMVVTKRRIQKAQ
ncbi:Coiled-coil domain-containing protein 96, partial [Rhizophlyctis rosea]